MKSAKHGNDTSAAEVTNISAHGLWALVDEKEYFLPYSEYPWFRDATVAQITHLEVPRKGHLHWPDLDVDLSIACLERPEDFPLKSRV